VNVDSFAGPGVVVQVSPTFQLGNSPEGGCALLPQETGKTRERLTRIARDRIAFFMTMLSILNEGSLHVNKRRK